MSKTGSSVGNKSQTELATIEPEIDDDYKITSLEDDFKEN